MINRPSLFLVSLFSLLPVSLLSGCSNIWITEGQLLVENEAGSEARGSLATSSEPVAEEEGSKDAVSPDQIASVEAASGTAEIPGIEVMWGVPSKAVEVYHLYYGLQPNRLDSQVTVPVDKLEKIDHPAHGPVYRYRLRDVPRAEAIYVAIRAENSAGVSEATAPFKVDPQ